MLKVHQCSDVAAKLGDDGNSGFSREYFARFWSLGATFATEQGGRVLPDLLDIPGNSEMGPESEREFRGMISWLNAQHVRHGFE